jgi:hypothetical protein
MQIFASLNSPVVHSQHLQDDHALYREELAILTAVIVRVAGWAVGPTPFTKARQVLHESNQA